MLFFVKTLFLPNQYKPYPEKKAANITKNGLKYGPVAMNGILNINEYKKRISIDDFLGIDKATKNPITPRIKKPNPAPPDMEIAMLMIVPKIPYPDMKPPSSNREGSYRIVSTQPLSPM